MLNNLKILTFSYIAEHDRLTKDEKLQLGEFVKEANKDQVLNLLITGYPQSESISEKFVKENKEVVSELNKHFNIVRVGDHFGIHASSLVVGIAVIAFVLKLFSASVKYYQDYISINGQKCRDLKISSAGRDWCMANVKAQGYEKQIKSLNGSIKECKKTSDPSKCVSKIKEKIIKLNGKMKEQLSKAEKYKQQSNTGQRR